jgi:hypothetical protein
VRTGVGEPGTPLARLVLVDACRCIQIPRDEAPPVPVCARGAGGAFFTSSPAALHEAARALAKSSASPGRQPRHDALPVTSGRSQNAFRFSPVARVRLSRCSATPGRDPTEACRTARTGRGSGVDGMSQETVLRHAMAVTTSAVPWNRRTAPVSRSRRRSNSRNNTGLPGETALRLLDSAWTRCHKPQPLRGGTDGPIVARAANVQAPEEEPTSR